MLPKEKLAFYQRARQLRPLASELPNGAARLTDTVLVAWLKARYPLLSRKNLHFGKSLYVEPKVQALAAWLRERDLLESIFWLSSAYALWVGAEVRDAHAMFFTPPELSTRLIENLESNGAEFAQHVFIDPACGGAAFLAPLAVWMRAELAKKGLSPTAILRHIQSHLLGAEIDSTLCRISEFFLRMALYDDIVSAGIEPKFNIRLGDSLKVLEKLYGRIDVVICNPLYRKMKPTEVDLYRKVYGDFIEGQPNLYGLFFGLTLKLLKHDGIAGLLTPTSFLSGQYFSKLRTCLLTHADTPQLDIIGKRLGVFIGVEQETAITVLKKRALQKVAPSSSRVFVFAPSSRAFQDVGTCALPDSGSAWPVPRKPSDTETIQAVSGSRFHLTDYGYKARVGAFVWNRDKRKKFKSEAEARCNGRAIYPLIWSSDICQDGSFVFNREKDEKHTPFVDMERPECTSTLCRPCVALQRVTSSDQARRLVAAPIDPKLFDRYGGVVAENHIILLEQVVDRPVLEPAQLAAVLRSKPIDQLSRCISGAANVSVFELSQLPLPDPNVLVEELKRHPDIDSAVLNAFYRTINSGYSRVREWLKTKDCSSMIKFFGRIDVKQQRHVENRPIHEAEACTRTEP